MEWSAPNASACNTLAAVDDSPTLTNAGWQRMNFGPLTALHASYRASQPELTYAATNRAMSPT
jgi:hypothetical protein